MLLGDLPAGSWARRASFFTLTLSPGMPKVTLDEAWPMRY